MAHACNPSTLGGREGWIARSRNQDQRGQHGETPSLNILKIQKLSEIGGTRALRLLERLKQENRLNPGGRDCSEPRSCQCPPAWVTEWDSDFLLLTDVKQDRQDAHSHRVHIKSWGDRK